jgi:hypothetical protein
MSAITHRRQASTTELAEARHMVPEIFLEAAEAWEAHRMVEALILATVYLLAHPNLLHGGNKKGEFPFFILIFFLILFPIH